MLIVCCRYPEAGHGSVSEHVVYAGEGEALYRQGCDDPQGDEHHRCRGRFRRHGSRVVRTTASQCEYYLHNSHLQNLTYYYRLQVNLSQLNQSFDRSINKESEFLMWILTENVTKVIFV